jgi:hypothetical protein
MIRLLTYDGNELYSSFIDNINYKDTHFLIILICNKAVKFFQIIIYFLIDWKGTTEWNRIKDFM